MSIVEDGSQVSFSNKESALEALNYIRILRVVALDKSTLFRQTVPSPQGLANITCDLKRQCQELGATEEELSANKPSVSK